MIISIGLSIGVQILWLKYHGGPGLYKEIRNTAGVLAALAAVGVVEEIGKWLTLFAVDLKKYQIQSINDALRYSLASALGFAFAENILYFSRLINDGKFADLFATVVLRSTLVIAGHLIFSGIAGYYYGVGKFSAPLTEHAYWKGKRFSIADTLKIPRATWYKVTNVLTGLSIAIVVHAAFNALMELKKVELNFLIIIVGIFFILYLLQQRGGRLILGLKVKQKSTMDDRAEAVVLELMGRWINKGKYKEVIEIGDRLLQRDPLNPVIHIFIAEAYQNIELKRARKVLYSLFTDEEYHEEQSIFEKAKN